jgi:hypothetical protein
MSRTQMAPALAAIVAAGLLTASAQAQPAPAAAPPLDPTTTLFCKNDNGEIDVLQYASLGTAMRKFATRFNFKLTVQTNPMVLTFSNPAESPYFIAFKAMPYHDENGHSGIALLSAHASLENTDEEIQGQGMCFFAVR